MPTKTIHVETEAPMRELYEANGYDPDALVHPKDVTPEMVTEGTKAVVYTVMRNPDPDAPATGYFLETFEVGPEDVWTPAQLARESDGAVTYSDRSPVEHCVRWGYRGMDDLPKVIYINEDLYADNPEDDPFRWGRRVGHVHGRSDDFIRFMFP